MISKRSMQAAKSLCERESLGPPERLPFFVEAQKDTFHNWILRGSIWRPRKFGWNQSDETKSKISESMKGNTNRRKK